MIDMAKRRLKNTVINWSFHGDEYKDFTQKQWSIIERIPGYLSQMEAFFLYQTAKSLTGATRGVDQPKADSIVEIGSYRGRSTVAIGLGLKDNTNANLRLFCVDPFFENKIEKGLKEEFLKNVSNAGLRELITCIPKYSREAAKEWLPHNGIAMLWIDGNHEFEHVHEDYSSWSRFLVSGGIIAFHDWYLIGVKETVTKYLFAQDWFQDFVAIDNNLIAASRIDRSPTWHQRAIKKRIYWALRTGSTNPLIALLAMVYESINRPFGHLRSFFISKLNIQKEC